MIKKPVAIALGLVLLMSGLFGCDDFSKETPNPETPLLPDESTICVPGERVFMPFKEYLEFHGVWKKFFNPEGTLARMDVDQEGVSVFLPFQKNKRDPGLTVPISQVIVPGLSVKFAENFKTQTYGDTASSEGFDLPYGIDPKATVFYEYIEWITPSKDVSRFPFGTFLKVQRVETHTAYYEEPDGTVWEISHIPLTDINWIEVLAVLSPCSD